MPGRLPYPPGHSVATMGGWGSGPYPVPVMPYKEPEPEPITLTEREARVVYVDDEEMLRFIGRGHKPVVQPGTEEYERALAIRDKLRAASQTAYREVHEETYQRARAEAESDFEQRRIEIERGLTAQLREELRERLMSQIQRAETAVHKASEPESTASTWALFWQDMRRVAFGWMRPRS